MQVKSCFAVLVAASLLAGSAAAQSSLSWIDRQTAAQPSICEAAGCAIDSSGNVHTAGNIGFTGTTSGDVIVIKYAPSGAVLWSRTFDPLGGNDRSFGLAVGPGGLVHELGTSSVAIQPEQTHLVTWDALGNPLWQTFLPMYARGAIVVGTLGEVLCLGSTMVGSSGQASVTALSSGGAPLWSNTFAGSATNDDLATSAAQDAAGNWYVALSLDLPSPFNNHPMAGVAKIDSAGVVQWTRSYPGAFGAGVKRIAVAPDGYSVAVGYDKVGAGSFQMYSVAHDASGALQWAHTEAGPSTNDEATDVALDAQGIACVVGKQSLGSYGTLTMIRYSRSGTQLSVAHFAGTSTDVPRAPRVRFGSADQACVVAELTWLFAPPTPGRVLLLQLDSSGALMSSKIHPSVPHTGLILRGIDLSANAQLAIACTEGPNLAQSVTTMLLDLNDAPQAYCTSKVNSLGCSPWIAFVGKPGAAATSGFVVQASNVLANKSGLFFYGVNGKASIPFQGGTLCIQVPIRRTPVGNSGGTLACSGQFALDFNAFAHGSLGGAPLPALIVAGTAVCCQSWSRDPGFAAPNNTSLSNALRYVVQP